MIAVYGHTWIWELKTRESPESDRLANLTYVVDKRGPVSHKGEDEVATPKIVLRHIHKDFKKESKLYLKVPTEFCLAFKKLTCYKLEMFSLCSLVILVCIHSWNHLIV